LCCSCFSTAWPTEQRLFTPEHFTEQLQDQAI